MVKPIYEVESKEQFEFLENLLNNFLEHYRIKTKERLMIQPGGIAKPGLCIAPYCGSARGGIEAIIPRSEKSVGRILNSSSEHILFDFGDATYLIRYKK